MRSVNVTAAQLRAANNEHGPKYPTTQRIGCPI